MFSHARLMPSTMIGYLTMPYCSPGCVQRIPLIQAFAFSMIVMFTGCASLDADRELELAAIASNRIAGSLSPQEAWSLPVEGGSPVWNGSEPLTYDAAVGVALQGDPSLRSALAVIVERRAQYVQEGLPPNPTVAFGIGFAVDGMAGAPMMVQGIQMLSWLWKNPWRVEAAEADLRAAIYDAAERCVIVLAKTRIQLAAVLAAQELLLLDEQYVDITQKTIDLVQAMQLAGELAELDLDRAQVDHQQAIASLVASEYALQEAKLELLGTMGRPDATTEWIALGELPPKWDIPAEEEELLELAALGRLDVASALESVRKIEGELGLAGTRRFPEVGFNMSYRKNFSGRESLVPGASVTLPILDNGEPAIAIQKARLEQARMNLLAASEIAQREVRMTYNQLLDARKRVEIIRFGQLNAAIRAQERSDSAYAEGEVSLNTLLLTQRQRIEVERDLIRMEFQTMQAMCMLRQAVGGSFDMSQDMVPEIEIQARPQKVRKEQSS